MRSQANGGILKLAAFMEIHGSKMGFLETAFLTNVFFEDFGEAGLDMIEPEVSISRNDGSERTWRIDFVVTTSERKFAIECDGFNYHAAGMVSKERFNELESKRNETIRQGFELVSLSKDQIVDDPQAAIYELRRSFNLDKDLYSIFLRWNEGKTAPHDAQKRALKALHDTRAKGADKGLVVMATGLGKTYTSIFDAESFQAKSILFVVHVEHILKQTKNSFEKVMPARLNEMGFYTGVTKELEGKNIIFATVQTLSRSEHLNKFSSDHFDYIIIDEAHHTAAASYRRITDHFNPKFLLGLTATPDRLDEKDILQFFGNNLVFEMGQEEAIRQGYLAKLKYIGFADNVDYSKIHYNGFRYDVNDLNKLLMIETRDKAIISKFTELAAKKKTIAFCVSIDHAEWSAEQFRLSGINAIALHSKVEAGHSESGVVTAKEILSAFENDEYQVVFVVDMLNEGIDIPDVECLLMMRPTQSSTILTQQIGRGLRIAPGKQEVLVLDFIGNYRTAPTILKGLGIGGIGKLTFDQDKDVYYYDNEGRTVEFEGSVVEIFKVVLSKSSREVDESLITEDWAFYSEYLKEMVSSGRHLYWSIAKKNNKIPMHLWAIDFALKNLHAHNDNKSLDSALQVAWRQFSPSASSMEGIRALIFSKILGLITSTYPFEVSDAYKQRFAGLTSTNIPELTEAVTDQFEKYFFYSDFFSLVNRHAVEGERREIDRFFKLFPIFFIYEVLFALRDLGYEDLELSQFELQHFVFFAGSRSEVDEVVERIANYREYSHKSELEKKLKQSAKGMDSRVFAALMNIKYFSWNPSRIKVQADFREELETKLKTFISLDEAGRIPKFDGANPGLYKKMLWSEKDLIKYCSE